MPPRNITTTLTVNIVDVLDPPPTFTESIYTEEIVEDVYANVRILIQLLNVRTSNDFLPPTATDWDSTSY